MRPSAEAAGRGVIASAVLAVFAAGAAIVATAAIAMDVIAGPAASGDAAGVAVVAAGAAAAAAVDTVLEAIAESGGIRERRLRYCSENRRPCSPRSWD